MEITGESLLKTWCESLLNELFGEIGACCDLLIFWINNKNGITVVVVFLFYNEKRRNPGLKDSDDIDNQWRVLSANDTIDASYLYFFRWNLHINTKYITQAAYAGNARGYHSEYGNSWFKNRENDDVLFRTR